MNGEKLFSFNHIVLSLANVVAFAREEDDKLRKCRDRGGKLSFVLEMRSKHLQNHSISGIFVLANI